VGSELVELFAWEERGDWEMFWEGGGDCVLDWPRVDA
jgi:hypothetical protein